MGNYFFSFLFFFFFVVNDEDDNQALALANGLKMFDFTPPHLMLGAAKK